MSPLQFCETDYDLSKYILPPLTHPKIATVTAKYQVLHRSIIFYLVKDITINSSISPKLHISLSPSLTMIRGLISL